MENYLTNIRPFIGIILAMYIAIPLVIAWLTSRALCKKKFMLSFIPVILFALILIFGLLVQFGVLLPTTGMLGELIAIFGGSGVIGAGMGILYCYAEKLWNKRKEVIKNEK